LPIVTGSNLAIADHLSPVSVQKSTDPWHLIVIVKLWHIVANHADKFVGNKAPVGVRVRTAVAQNILSFPPNIQVKCISVRRAKPRRGHANQNSGAVRIA
jgi:hypothetical protein